MADAATEPPLSPTRRAHLEQIGTAFGHIANACKDLPEARVAHVAETLEHAAELLEAEAHPDLR